MVNAPVDSRDFAASVDPLDHWWGGKQVDIFAERGDDAARKVRLAALHPGNASRFRMSPVQAERTTPV